MNWQCHWPKRASFSAFTASAESWPGVPSGEDHRTSWFHEGWGLAKLTSWKPNMIISPASLLTNLITFILTWIQELEHRIRIGRGWGWASIFLYIMRYFQTVLPRARTWTGFMGDLSLCLLDFVFTWLRKARGGLLHWLSSIVNVSIIE